MRAQGIAGSIFTGCILIGALISISGCSPQVQAAIDAFNGQAVAQLEYDADHVLAAEIYGICATPLSTLTRNQSKHPGLIKGVEALCGTEPALNAGSALEAAAAKPPLATAGQ